MSDGAGEVGVTRGVTVVVGVGVAVGIGVGVPPVSMSGGLATSDW